MHPSFVVCQAPGLSVCVCVCNETAKLHSLEHTYTASNSVSIKTTSGETILVLWAAGMLRGCSGNNFKSFEFW